MESYLLGVYEKSMPNELALGEKLKAAAAAGFDYLELSIDETDAKLARLEWSKDDVRALLAAQDEAGIPVKSICLSGHRRFPLGHPERAVRTRSLEIMRDAISLAARLGIRVIQIAGYDVYYEPSTAETREIFGGNLRRSAEMAAREGVILAFETMETEFMDTVEKALRWVELIGSPYLQLYPDLGNITNAAEKYGTDALQDLRKGRGHVAALHLKETKTGLYREVPYGTGHVDFPAAAEAARELGVRLFVGEFWHAGEAEWRRTLRDNGAFLRRALAAGGFDR